MHTTRGTVLVLALALCAIAVAAFAQDYHSNTSIRMYATPAAASYEIDRSFDSVQTDRAALIPIVAYSKASANVPGIDYVSYAVVYTRNDTYDSTCAVEQAGYSSPDIFGGQFVTCGSGTGWSTFTSTSFNGAHTFYDSLSALQKLTAILIRAAGNQIKPWLVVYQASPCGGN